MKLKLGFVSNSSSTSFCMLGITLSIINERLRKLGLSEIESDYDEIQDKINIDDNIKLDFDRGISDYYGDYIIGQNPESLDEDLTILRHKKNIADKINKTFGTDFTGKDVGFHTDGGYEG